MLDKFGISPLDDAMKVTAKDITDYFILLSDGADLTNLKAQKLVYYAYGLYLARYNKRLFQTPIEAWEYGPVVSDLYQQLKQYKDNPIPLSPSFDASKIDEEMKKFLKEVYLMYGDYTAERLCFLSHAKATPWDVVYHDGTNNNLINDSLMHVYFSELDLLLSQKKIDQIKAAKILSQDSSLAETMYILSHPEDAKNLNEAMKSSIADAVEIDWIND